MLPASSVEEFVANPVGKYFGGVGFLVWCTADDLCGAAVWGRRRGTLVSLPPATTPGLTTVATRQSW
jgi:hypothetical protein